MFWFDSFCLAGKHLISTTWRLRKLNRWVNCPSKDIKLILNTLQLHLYTYDTAMSFLSSFCILGRSSVHSLDCTCMQACTVRWTGLIVSMQKAHTTIFIRFQSRTYHCCWHHRMQRICLYVPLLPPLFMPQHLGQNSLSSLLEAAAPRLAPISVCAQQLQRQQQHNVSEPWLAVDVEMGGVMSYYRVICVYLHVTTV